MAASHSHFHRSSPDNGSPPATAKTVAFARNPRETGATDWRLRKHADYQRVYKASRKQFSASMTYFHAPQPATLGRAGARVGLTAGKVLGGAVERNRIKRRMREAVRHNLTILPARVDVILHPRRSVLAADFAALKLEVESIFTTIATKAPGARQS